MANVTDIATRQPIFIRPQLPPRLTQPLEYPVACAVARHEQPNQNKGLNHVHDPMRDERDPGSRPSPAAQGPALSLLRLLVAAVTLMFFAAMPAAILAMGALVLIPVVLLSRLSPLMPNRRTYPVRAEQKRPRRCGRIVADHRPILLRPVIVLPPSRRAPRVIGPAPAKIPHPPPRRRAIGSFNRESRILRPQVAHQSESGLLSVYRFCIRPTDYGNDNLPPVLR